MTWKYLRLVARVVLPVNITFPSFVTLTLLWNATASQAWDPPIGIPTPSFGISESHTMYTGKTFDYNGNGQIESGETYRDAGNGPYTHYVDNTNPACTDDNNFGSPSKPLCRIPLNLTAGSVVEVHGRYDVSHYSPRDIRAKGTADRPIFIRGASSSSPPYMTQEWDIFSGTYLILENLEFGDQDGNLGGFNGSKQFTSGGTSGVIVMYGTQHHIAVRHCNIHGNMDTGGLMMGDKAEDIVIYHNNIHDNGNYQAPDDDPRHGADIGGVGIGRESKRIWVVDNACSRNGRGCVNINPGYISDGTIANALIQYVYVGRNVGRENRETNFWTKHANHVIFSQNTASGSVDFRTDDHRGAGMGFQYGPDNVWFLFNHIYDEGLGIGVQSDSVENAGQNSYFIGNVIHNIHHGPGLNYDPDNGWSGAAIRLSNGNNRYVIGNTIYDADAGINTPSSSPIYISDNIIANITEPRANHIYIQYPKAWDIKNGLFFQSGSDARIRLGDNVYSVPQLLSLGKGQGSITSDPKFVNAVANDFHLAPASPAINTGYRHPVYDTFYKLYGIDIAKDVDKVARPQGSSFDIGAYEFGTQITQFPSPPTNLRVLMQ